MKFSALLSAVANIRDISDSTNPDLICALRTVVFIIYKPKSTQCDVLAELWRDCKTGIKRTREYFMLLSVAGSAYFRADRKPPPPSRGLKRTRLQRR